MQLIDYDIDEATWGTAKKPYRYRWPEHVHDEVLARLRREAALHARRIIACLDAAPWDVR